MGMEEWVFIIFMSLAVTILRVFGLKLGFLETVIVGGVVGVLASLVANKYYKNKAKKWVKENTMEEKNQI